MQELKEKTDALVNNNYGLVHSCANKFRKRGVEYDDLFQAGCIGLIKASRNFDESRGFAFSTYAVPVILGEIRRIFRDGGSVKIGRTLKEKSRNAMKIKEQLATELGREPSISELAQKLDLDIYHTCELITISMPTISLTSTNENSDCQIDIPVDPPEEQLADKMALRTVMDTLEEKERRLIELRYFDGLTQVKTAQQLGMSQVQVSRKEKAILLKLRELMLN